MAAGRRRPRPPRGRRLRFVRACVCVSACVRDGRGVWGGSFRDNEIRALLEMRGISGADMSWVREGVEGDEVGDAARHRMP
jgi:hypothetical protein